MTTQPPAEPEHDHLTWEDIEHFLLHTEQPSERKALFHLLALCATCREAAGPLLELYRQGEITGYVTLLDVELLISEREAPALWRGLEEETLRGETDEQKMSELLDSDPRWPTWGLVLWLARESLARADLEPDRASAWSYLAEVGAAQLLSDDSTPKEWIQELRAFATAASGHVQRVRGKPVAALGCFRVARSYLDASEDPADYLPFRSCVYELEADAWLSLGRGGLGKALDCLDQALAAWALVERDRPEDRARVLVARGDVLKVLDRSDEARQAYAEAADLLDTSDDPETLGRALRTKREER